MLARLFTLAILAVIGYFMLKSYFAAPRRPARRPDLKPNSPDDPEEMVVCAGCGAYVSEPAALVEPESGNPLYFCNQACRRQWLAGKIN